MFKQIKEHIENNCSSVIIEPKKLIRKFDYKISLKRNYSYSTNEKRYIMSSYKLKELIYKVLNVEAPIHIDECFERITKYLCLKSAKLYYFDYKNCLNQEIESGKIIERNNFLYLSYTRIIIRNRLTPEYEVYCGKLNISYIPPDEIIKIAKAIIKHEYSIDEEELAKIVSQEIGFGRLTKKINDTIFEAFELLKNDDEVQYKIGRYYYIPIIKTSDIITIAKDIILHYKNIKEEDLVKQIIKETGSKASEIAIFDGLKFLRNSAKVKYEYGNYSIQENSNQIKQIVSNQKSEEQFEGLIDKILKFFSNL